MRFDAILVFPPLVFLVICLIPSAILLTLRIRQGRILTKAGISYETPGCTKCWYIMKGWNSSVCPECGTDAKKANVRIGVKSSKWIKALNALGIAILIVVFGIFPLGYWLFEASSISQQWTIRSMDEIKYEIQIKATNEFRLLPPKDESIIVLRIKPNAEMKGIGLLPSNSDQIEVRADWERQGYSVLYLDSTDVIPTEQEISVFLADALELDTNSLKPHAAELNKVLIEASKLGKEQSTNLTRNSLSYLIRPSGSSIINTLWRPGVYLMLFSVLITVVILPAYAIFQHKPGIRPVGDGEWLTSAKTDSTTN